MSFGHLRRIERTIKIGGRSIGIGPLRHRVGGNEYTVGPISVFKWVILEAMLTRLYDNKPLDEAFAEKIKALPVDISAMFLPLLVLEPIKEKDLDRATTDQVLSAWIAFCECNDLAYIQDKPGKEDQKKIESAGLAYDDWAVLLCEKTSGARLPHEFLQLPIQMFLSIIHSFERLDNVRNGKPADAERPPENEVEARKEAFRKLGIRVI